MIKKCLYCNKQLIDKHLENKIGYFCNENHFNKFIKSLSDEEYIELQNKFCICSDD
ncbi:MAG: hypothetical protein ACRDA3_06060 [Peptostreptococcaceae bacterium]